jgi:hypothetical protein
MVEGYIDDFKLEAKARTAKKAFAEAMEWHVVRQFSAVSIRDGSRSYSIPEFADAMALQEIAEPCELAGRRCGDKIGSWRITLFPEGRSASEGRTAPRAR